MSLPPGSYLTRTESPEKMDSRVNNPSSNPFRRSVTLIQNNSAAPLEIAQSDTQDSTSSIDSAVIRLHAEHFDHCQRTLNTLIIAGTFMAGVEATMLVQALSPISPPSLTNSQTASLCFLIFALFSTSFVALYSAVTYIWLQPQWESGPLRFHEWVGGSTTAMIRWCSTLLVAGIYAGFVGFVVYLFDATSRTIGVFTSVVLAVCGIFPMTWGFYYWYGLYKGYLEWVPQKESNFPRKKRPSEDYFDSRKI